MVLMALGGLAADQTERVLHVWDTGLRAAWAAGSQLLETVPVRTDTRWNA